MNDQLWSWALTIVGATCFYLAGGLNGRKVWWAWYIGLFAQVLWATYALLDLEHRAGFLVGVILYGYVYVRNCVNWTREHLEEKRAAREARVAEVTDLVMSKLGREGIREAHFLPTTSVQLTRFDVYLHGYHNVIPNETIGKVIDWSRLAPDDHGVLVDWGDGETVRAEVTELRPMNGAER
ncbi:PnuC-like nicotinamide riboside transporter [Microbacterium phage Fizzles]|nr:PnuC-like nicotinamide riboside transporter [Microbacterium phage Fizzles]